MGLRTSFFSVKIRGSWLNDSGYYAFEQANYQRSANVQD